MHKSSDVKPSTLSSTACKSAVTCSKSLLRSFSTSNCVSRKGRTRGGAVAGGVRQTLSGLGGGANGRSQHEKKLSACVGLLAR